MARLLSRLRDFGITGLPPSALQWSQRVCEQIEAAFADQQSQIDAIAAAQAAADAAQSTANTAVTNAATAQTSANAAQSTATTANANAATAQSTANSVHTNDSISSSWTSPGVILSATDAGSSATVSIGAHTRKYNDATGAAITAASITGLSYSTKYFIYYDDSPRAGGAVTFHATTDPNAALPGAAAGRHYCGDITTPASGGGGTTGGVSPPGSGGQLGGGDIP